MRGEDGVERRGRVLPCPAPVGAPCSWQGVSRPSRGHRNRGWRLVGKYSPGCRDYGATHVFKLTDQLKDISGDGIVYISF